MGEGDWLCPLKMCIAWHYGVKVILRQFYQYAFQAEKHSLDGFYIIPQIHAEIKGHLVIAASAGMQLFASLADPVNKYAFNIHMYIFSRHVELDPALFDVIKDFKQGLPYELGFVQGYYPALSKHSHMGGAAQDILAVHPAVKPYGCVKIIHKGISILFKPTGPKLHVFPLLMH